VCRIHHEVDNSKPPRAGADESGNGEHSKIARPMEHGTRWVAFALALGMIASVQRGVSGHPQRPRSQPMVIPSMDGRDLFEFYCATCHGRDGTGGGPVASALKTPPADLTKIAARNGGTFPRARVIGLVTGDDILGTSAHGSREMPVWGPIFHALDPAETVNKVRITNIVDHLERIQRPR